MNQLSTTISHGFVHYFDEFRQRVHSLSKGLSEEQFWAKPYSYGNSFGNLVLHLTGNLSYYIGSQIENNGYVRNRELEFTDIRMGCKREVLANLDDSIAMVVHSLNNQAAEDWVREYDAVGVDDVPDRFSIYLRCSVHFHHHIGQMIYLVKELSKPPREMGSC